MTSVGLPVWTSSSHPSSAACVSVRRKRREQRDGNSISNNPIGDSASQPRCGVVEGSPLRKVRQPPHLFPPPAINPDFILPAERSVGPALGLPCFPPRRRFSPDICASSLRTTIGLPDSQPLPSWRAISILEPGTALRKAQPPVTRHGGSR